MGGHCSRALQSKKGKDVKANKTDASSSDKLSKNPTSVGDSGVMECPPYPRSSTTEEDKSHPDTEELPNLSNSSKTSPVENAGSFQDTKGLAIWSDGAIYQNIEAEPSQDDCATSSHPGTLIMEQNGWDVLPDELLMKIFRLLREVDLVNASSTCTHWRRVFHDASLWRTRTFDFRRRPNVNLEKIDSFVSTLGHHLKELRIVCSKTSPVSLMDFRNFLETLLTSFTRLDYKKSNMRSFHLENLHFDRSWKNDDVDRCCIVACIGNFLLHQTKLEEISFVSAGFSCPFDKIVFGCLAKSCSFRVLRVLNLVNSDICLGEELNECKSLEKISLNYTNLACLRFDVLWHSLKGTLKCLDIHGTANIDRCLWDRDMIWPDRWVLFKHLFPKVQVRISFENTEVDPRKYLVEGIPLVAYSWKENDIHAVNLGDRANCILNCLTRYHGTTLTSVNLFANGRTVSPVGRRMVSQFVAACPHVTELNFSENLVDRGFLEEIKRDILRRRQQVQSRLVSGK